MMAKGILRTIRGNAGLTQEEAAEKLFVSVSTIQRWERTDACSPKDLQRMLQIYNVDSGTAREITLGMYGGTLYKSELYGSHAVILYRIASTLDDLRCELSKLLEKEVS